MEIWSERSELLSACEASFGACLFGLRKVKLVPFSNIELPYAQLL